MKYFYVFAYNEEFKNFLRSYNINFKLVFDPPHWYDGPHYIYEIDCDENFYLLLLITFVENENFAPMTKDDVEELNKNS